MAYTPPTYTPSGSLFGSTPAATPYTYGNLGNTTSAYNLWGSKGNPYLVAGPTYTPGAGAPINPQPVAPVTYPINNGGDSSPIPDWVDPNSAESRAQSYGDLQSWLDRDRMMTKGISSLFGAPLFDPAVDLMYGINPYTQQSYSWYDGSTDDFGYVDSDRDLGSRQYSQSLAAYQADKAVGMTDETWGERWAADKAQLDAANKTAQPVNSWWNNIWGGTPTTPTVNTPKTFGNPNSALAQQARANISAAAIEQNKAVAAAGGHLGSGGGPAGTVTYSDGSTSSSLSDMQSGSSGSYSSADSGNVGVTSYGDGQYGFTDTNGEEVGYEDPDGAGGSESSGGSDGGGGGSYIATAATQALGKEGLDMFEGWRDYMHTAHPTFTTSYGRYRVTAPKIVSAIDKKTNSKELYQDIWNEYLKPIFGLIKKDMNNPKALSDYKVMVKELTNKYLKGDK